MFRKQVARSSKPAAEIIKPTIAPDLYEHLTDAGISDEEAAWNEEADPLTNAPDEANIAAMQITAPKAYAAAFVHSVPTPTTTAIIAVEINTGGI